MVNSRAKGVKAEQDLGRYLRSFGAPWQDARRYVAAGWSNGSSESADRGDMAGVPGFCIQVKDTQRALVGKFLHDTWRDVRDQAAAIATPDGVVVPIIVEKRTGSAEPARWWLHMSATDYMALLLGRPVFLPAPHLVRVELGDVIADLRAWSLTRS